MLTTYLKESDSEYSNGKITTYVQVYAPCNDSYSDEVLSDVINSTKNQDAGGNGRHEWTHGGE